MKRIYKGSDLVIKLDLKEKCGCPLDLCDTKIINDVEVKVYTKNTSEADIIVVNDLEDLKDNLVKIQSEDLEKLERGIILIDLYIKFTSEVFSDFRYDYKTILTTNFILE